MIAGADEDAKRFLITTIWHLQIERYYANIAPCLSSPDVLTRQCVIAVYEQIPPGDLVPIRPLLDAACASEPYQRLKARLTALIASLGG